MRTLALARLGLRRRVGALLALALLLAVVAGVVLSLVGGARRTVGALDRLRAESLAGDLYVQPFEPEPARLDELRAHPDVNAVGQRAIAFLRIEGTDPDLANETIAAAAVDDQYLRTVDRPQVLEGTMPDVDDPHAIAITEAAVQELGVGVGEEVRLESLTQAQVESFIFEGKPYSTFDGPRPTVEVTALVQTVDEALGLNVDRLLFTPAFWSEYGDQIGGFDNLVLLDARDGADLDALSADIRELWSDDPELAVVRQGEALTATRDLLRTQAIGLLVAAAAIGVAGLVVVAQALRRATGEEDAVLAVLGLTRAQRARLGAVPLAASVALGTALALLGAAIASRAFPTGRAARVEPAPGVRLDLPLLLTGGAVVLVVALALVVVIAVLSTRSPRSTTTEGRIARTVSRGPATVSAAAHLATRRGVPARPALAGAIVALLGAVAAAVFGASLTRLIDEPARDGYAWDAEVGMGDGLTDADAREVAVELADRSGIAGVLLTRYAQTEVAAQEVQNVGLDAVEGEVGMLVLDGDLPGADDEVALGPKTADALDAAVGDSVELAGPEGDRQTFQVSGLVRFPNVADEDPAVGVAMTLGGQAQLIPPDPEFGPPGFPTLLVTFSPEVDHAAMRDDLADEYPLVNGPRPSNRVLSLREVQGVPPTLVAILGGLGLAAVVHALVVSVRRARRDLSVLAAVGFVRRQRATVVVAQAIGYFGLGVIVGVPLGLVVGRWTWQRLADQISVAADPRLPPMLALVVPAALAVALVAAASPARRAARLQPAEHLRTE